jgi:hypothetical protein
MSDYSRWERLEIERAFSLAKNHVSMTYSIGAKEQFICHALRRLHDRRIISTIAYDDAVGVIMERLRPYGNCVESYLTYVGIEHGAYPRDEVQKYRHRWLDALIEEFGK